MQKDIVVMQTEKTDVLVIGAGPAGSIASSILHQQGFEVKVVENNYPHGFNCLQ